MQFLEAWLIENCIIGALLAVAVLVLIHICRPRPAMEHLLWAVVLLKFVMPPLSLWPEDWQTPVPAWMAPSSAAIHVNSPTPVPPAETASVTIFFPASSTADKRSSPIAQAPLPASTAPEATRVSTRPRLSPLRHPLAFAWIVSAALAACFQMRRWRRFQRGLSGIEPAPEALLVEVQAVAQALNCRPPRVLLSEWGATPLVWGIWKPTLLWPKSLEGRLSPVARQSILLHELTHLRRRDHWTAWLDLTAGCLWWWHPACWLARSRLREAAELACDAEVLHRRPEAGHEYATALVTVCEMMSRSARPALTVGAASPARRFFARRLNMILSKRLLIGIPLWFTGVLAGVLLMLLPKLPPLTYQHTQFIDVPGRAMVSVEVPQGSNRQREVSLASERHSGRATNLPETKQARPMIADAMDKELLDAPTLPPVNSPARPGLASIDDESAPRAAPPRKVPSLNAGPESLNPFVEAEPTLPVTRDASVTPLLEIDPALQSIEIQYLTAGTAPPTAEALPPMGVPAQQRSPGAFDLTWGKTRLRCLKAEYHRAERGADVHAIIQAGNNELQIEAPGLKLGGMTKLRLNLQELKIDPSRINTLLNTELRIAHIAVPLVETAVTAGNLAVVEAAPAALIQWGELTLYVTEAEFAHGAHANDPVKLAVTADKISLIRKDVQLQAKQIILKSDSVTVGGAAVLENKTLPPSTNRTSFEDFGDDANQLPRGS